MAILDYQTWATEMVETVWLLFQVGVMLHSGNANIGARITGREVQLLLFPRNILPGPHADKQVSMQSSELVREAACHRMRWWMCITAAQIRLITTRLSIGWRHLQVWLRRYRVAMISGLVFFTIIAVYSVLWTRFTIWRTPDTWYWQVQHCLIYAWLLAVPQTVVNLQGYLFTHPRARIFTPDRAWDALQTPLHIRFVTRGSNPGAVQRTVEADQAVIAAFADLHGVRPRVTIEVVTGKRLPVGVAQYVVPPDFTTPHGALFKARALQYAVGVVPVAHNAWILHCDEETQITLTGLTGCLQFMQQEIELVNPGEYPAVGQGAILYHRDFWRRPFLTLADSMRTALDFGYFRVQSHVWHRPLYGLHGSYILVRQDIERAVDFDFDRYRSITEDAYWALRLVDCGIGLKWVHGFLSEQATFTIQDFLRQRKRWFTGLWHVAAGEGLRWRTKQVLRASVISWICGLMGTLAITIQLIHPIIVPWYILLPASMCLATNTSLAVYGLLVNFQELHLQTHGITWLIVLGQIVLAPIFAVLESTAILWALLTLITVKFHIVKK
jgi:egghead protein (zeste-white 4 protein)